MIGTPRTLGVEFPYEQARLKELLEQYESIGCAGAFGGAMIRDCLRRADIAWNEQDVVAMVRIFQEMKGFK